MQTVFCVDIGGSKLLCGAVTADGEILDTYRVEYPPDYTAATITDAIAEGYRRLSHHAFCACGVAVPGLCDYRSGLWLYSPFSGIGNLPIAQLVGGLTGLPTVADNDVNVSALAEKQFGLCKDKENFLWITVSNGIGGGLFLNGRLYRGETLSAGEIGHFIVEENGRRCGCKNTGCLEAYASGASISAIFRERTGRKAPAKEIADLARSGDVAAMTVWQQAGAYLGKAAAYAVNLLGLDTIVLGGGAAEAFDLLAPAAGRALSRYVFQKANGHVQLLHSAPGKYAALKGCAALALQGEAR